jgi:hypothetical protein
MGGKLFDQTSNPVRRFPGPDIRGAAPAGTISRVLGLIRILEEDQVALVGTGRAGWPAVDPGGGDSEDKQSVIGIVTPAPRGPHFTFPEDIHGGFHDVEDRVGRPPKSRRCI